MIEDAIEHDLESLAMRFGYKIQHELVGFRPFPRCGVLGFVDQFRQVASIAEIIVHMAVVGGVVLVQTGRLENRIQIEARNPEAAQIGKLFADALNVAAVAPVVHVVAAPPACAGRGAGSGSTPLHRPRHGIRRVVRLIAVAEALRENLIPDRSLSPRRRLERRLHPAFPRIAPRFRNLRDVLASGVVSGSRAVLQLKKVGQVRRAAEHDAGKVIDSHARIDQVKIVAPPVRAGQGVNYGSGEIAGLGAERDAEFLRGDGIEIAGVFLYVMQAFDCDLPRLRLRQISPVRPHYHRGIMSPDTVRFLQVRLTVLLAVVHPSAVHKKAVSVRALGQFHVGHKVSGAVRLQGELTLRPVIEFASDGGLLRRRARRRIEFKVVHVEPRVFGRYIDG